MVEIKKITKKILLIILIISRLDIADKKISELENMYMSIEMYKIDVQIKK